MSDISKISLATRKLVASASIARDAMLLNIRGRIDSGETVTDVETDILVTRIALALKALADAKTKDRQPWTDYQDAASVILGKKVWTKTAIVDDNLRSQDEQNIFGAASKWSQRAFKDLDIKTGETRGGSRKPKAPNAPQVDAPQVDAPQGFSIPKLTIPKASASVDLSQIISFLGMAASKALAEAASIVGDDAMLARDALSSIVKAQSDYQSAIDAARKAGDKPKRAAVVALALAHAPKAGNKPKAVAELN